MTLADEAARERIRDDTASTLFVDAGAGSGKTRSLIERIITLVLRDRQPLRGIVAITFTEKAGAELRDRLRAQLGHEWRTGTGERRDLAAEALDDLDSAAIGTLHSFAQRILTMHPIEAGLPPLIEVLDEVGSSVAFDARWSVMQRELLDDETLAPVLRLGLAAGVTLANLRSLARALQSDWDLIESHVLTEPEQPIPTPDIASLVSRARDLAARAAECTNDTDLFLPVLQGLSAWADTHASATDAESALSAIDDAVALKWGRGGKSASWGGCLADIKDACKQWQSDAASTRADLVNATLRPLTRWVARRVLDSARERAHDGRLEFHDLLVMARDLLRDQPDVRAALRERFPRLLLDEFQDTDPIQIEIAVRIAGGRDAGAPDWRDVAVPAGSLFVVGDPKQSIYRFRRADIAMYLDTQQWMDDTVTLRSNFRSVEPVVDWVNAVFGDLITAHEGAQPPYVPLAATRDHGGVGHSVLLLGADGHEGKPKAQELRELEATDVAAVIRQALDERWTTFDERTEEWRAMTPADITVLVPARTSLPFLEAALDRAGIAYRAESSSLVYQAAEVRDVLAAARALADPSDRFACVTALRSPLFGCGDDDLWTWRRDGGSFAILAPPDESRATHPVARALRCLADLYRRSAWMTPSELLGAIVEERRVLEVAASGSRARDQWRRLRFVVDQARAWSETEHGGLRGYLAWAARQGEEIGRVAEAVLPETDVDAVRVMTVHAAKGLQFPMVVLSGMSSQPRTQGGVRLLWTDGGYQVRTSKSLQTSDFENAQPVDEQMDAEERRRLLYVAATRARDHLVVSVHRGEGASSTNAALVAEAVSRTGARAECFRSPIETSAQRPAPALLRPAAPEWPQWHDEITAIRKSSSLPGARSASGLEGTDPEVVFATAVSVLPPDADAVAGTAKGARDLELPPWSKGRYGTAVGRAVHAVLQAVDLADGDGLDAAVAAQCLAEGVAEYADVVEALARSALDSDVIQDAARREHWREAYVGMTGDDGVVVEGFVDLLYRDDDGTLVVVDYKTDAVPAGAIPARVAYYAPQLHAYESALRAATGANSRSVLLFLHPDVPAHAVALGA